ncbi:MAG: universal stress protein [Gammaproteobacteria bacterium]|uniref:universal stress protein n=1 Tax=Rhodoferax sp. TaxID=50421 RepID=UPI0017F5B2F5|nr:universal stress protein [Rhodoferax sp.]MBU3900973.1 universal stress protein [Gammaproteobacteria bacterium]MBA3058335.1 universal stress protein [Rhodoferax sp.]MBU3996798.1 universal stress protein [Gammaproteobacteria bacterium]MBU4017647.1 universal stress protein [Gammaproteobacteria bacterium]MBU4081090.1 universal stress protein [Gammaproteobacteria bacterium]
MNSPLSLLVATDLSASSRHAAQRAAMLANRPGTKLDLVYVVEKNALADLRRLLGEQSAAMEGRFQSQANEALTQLAAQMHASCGTTVNFHVVEGSVPSAIAAQADSAGANLLVVGARGAGFMRHWLLGATAERLLRKTVRPILVVKQAPHESYRSVLVPVDFSPLTPFAIELTLDISPQVQLILLHACELPFEGKMRFAGVEEATILQHRETIRREALARLHEVAIDAKLAPGKWRPLVVFGNPSHCILEQEEEQGADLIVLGKHGMGMTEELLLGSVTKHVLSQARSDVLVVAR